MPIPRFNPSDPKLPDQVKPFKITPPKDNYASEWEQLGCGHFHTTQLHSCPYD